MLKTYAWVFYLYKTGIPSMAFFYDYRVAPPIDVLIRCADRINVKRTDFDSELVFTPPEVIRSQRSGNGETNIIHDQCWRKESLERFTGQSC